MWRWFLLDVLPDFGGGWSVGNKLGIYRRVLVRMGIMGFWSRLPLGTYEFPLG